MNVLFVSPCDFDGNSAVHILNIANELHNLGVNAAIAVPNNPNTARAHQIRNFQVLHHSETLQYGVTFPDGRGPDLVHAWTPRENVRTVTESVSSRYGCPYLVHLEDNEEAINSDGFGGFPPDELARLPLPLLDELTVPWRANPVRAKRFVAAASGMTVLIDRLLEFKPANVPGIVFWPGYEESFSKSRAIDAQARENLGLANGDRVLVYNGNIHSSNRKEVESLFLAVEILNRRGLSVKLLKTGMNYDGYRKLETPLQDSHVIDLGFVSRSQLPGLLHTADVLVQPGHANLFNDYRFPSKLPEFLITGKPVILPNSNLGRFMHDGESCLLLQTGHANEIAAKVSALLQDREMSNRIGAAGFDFALQHLDWASNVKPILEFYRQALDARPQPISSVNQESTPSSPVRLIAFYLPQFHPIPENDAWWGEGFTEWSNVAKAKPVFPGHAQPQLPADLGFYDLRLPSVMEKQAALAREYGVHGFCLYYYWFNGRKLLETPLQQMLSSGKPDFPFCLCWANENWTRTWDGLQNQILVEQRYSADADRHLIEELIPAFRDSRYIQVDGAPLFLIYRVQDLPDARATAERWRRVCAENGIPKIHLAIVQTFGVADPRPFGFDSAVEFPPHIKRCLVPPGLMPNVSPEFTGYMEDALAVAANQIQEPIAPYVRYRGVMPAWDNSARRGNNAHIVVRSSPALYQHWLSTMVQQALALRSVQEPLVFINAWNEWAEGAHLEPDQRNGRALLRATRDGLWSGILDGYRDSGLPISEVTLRNTIEKAEKKKVAALTVPSASPSKTHKLLDDTGLKEVLDLYGTRFQPGSLSYATVRDFCDSFDHLHKLTTLNGDLKDVQRPWILKAILGKLRPGARLLEIGAGEPFVADLLERLGYEVWVVDPYDGSGNGPVDLARFRAECPNVRFIQSEFNDDLLQAPAGAFDCIYSISVLEHIPAEGLLGVARGLRKYLKPTGLSIHAVDHVHRGPDSEAHLRGLHLMAAEFGFSAETLIGRLTAMDSDIETYYLSAESHNRWRGGVPYKQFPMRVCVSVQMVSTAAQIYTASGKSTPETVEPIAQS